MRTGCGEYAKADWDRAMAAAENVSDESIVSDLAEEIDLHEPFSQLPRDTALQRFIEVGEDEIAAEDQIE